MPSKEVKAYKEKIENITKSKLVFRARDYEQDPYIDNKHRQIVSRIFWVEENPGNAYGAEVIFSFEDFEFQRQSKMHSAIRALLDKMEEENKYKYRIPIGPEYLSFKYREEDSSLIQTEQ